MSLFWKIYKGGKFCYKGVDDILSGYILWFLWGKVYFVISFLGGIFIIKLVIWGRGGGSFISGIVGNYGWFCFFYYKWDWLWILGDEV